MEIILQPQIGVLALLPLLIFMVSASLLRYGIMELLKIHHKENLSEVVKMKPVTMSSLLRNSQVLTEASWTRQKTMLLSELEKLGNCYQPVNEQDDPILKALKPLFGFAGSIVFMVMNQALSAWVFYFYSGLIVMKTPFTVPHKLKELMNGDLKDPFIPANYISAMAAYFIFFVGCNTFLIILNEITEIGKESFSSIENISSKTGPSLGDSLQSLISPDEQSNDYVKEYQLLSKATYTRNINNELLLLEEHWRV